MKGSLHRHYISQLKVAGEGLFPFWILNKWICPCVLTGTHHSCGILNVMSVLRDLGFWSILDFQIRDAQPVVVIINTLCIFT